MRNSTRTEQRTLREVAHFLLPLLCCEFCGKPLLDPKDADKVFGNKAHTPLKKLKLTVHHRNGKHRDNRRSFRLLPVEENGEVFTSEQWNNNLDAMTSVQFAISGNTSLVHSPCHREHEMKKTHKNGGFKPKPMWQKALELLKQIKFGDHLTEGDCRFRDAMAFRYQAHKKKSIFSRYEIRRLKKLAAKSEK